MMNALMISATGMSAQQLAMDTISHNLANVNTTGFKAADAKFADVFTQEMQAASESESGTPTAVSVGLGVRNTGIERTFTQGSLQATGNSFDLAIQGDGFFQVQRPDGSLAYTRDGSFRLSSEGVLCNAQGYAVSPEIQIAADAAEVQIAPDGTVMVRRSQDSVARAVGQLELSRFTNPGGLASLGQNLYAATVASGDPVTAVAGQDGLGVIAQGNLEQSNVNLVQEMVNMIMTQRAYEVNTKSIQTADQMLQMANNLKRV